MNSRPLCIYHGNCMDGFTAAWVMWLKYPEAEFVPGVYGEAPPDCTGRDVYLLDFSYKRDVLKAIARQARKLVVLDHHKSAEKEFPNFWDANETEPHANVAGIFDMDKSGARLAWEWFCPAAMVPLFVRLVEDRDLWRFELANSRALNAAFFSHAYDFAQWTELAKACATQSATLTLVLQGEAILRKQDKDVRELITVLRHARRFTRLERLRALDIPCANLPYTLASDAAGAMAEGCPFAATYYQDAKGWYVFSLRSREGGVDVSEVAAVYGGGGHRNAAGFRIASLEDL